MPITGFACYELNATIECFYNTSIRHLNLFKVCGVTVCRFDAFLALSAFLVLLAALVASGIVLNLLTHEGLLTRCFTVTPILAQKHPYTRSSTCTVTRDSGKEEKAPLRLVIPERGFQ